MNKFKVSKLKLCLIIISLFVFIIYIFGYQNPLAGKIISFLLIGLCLFNMYRSRNNILEFILHLELFYYNYSVVFSRYLHIINEYESFYNNANVETLNIGILCLFIFEFFMTFFYDSSKTFKTEYIYANQRNEFISIVLLILAFIIGIFGFDWSNYGERFSITSYYEYIGIILILGLHYTGFEKSKITKNGYSLLIMLLILQGIIYGERVSALQFIFIWFFYFKGNKIKPKYVLILTIFGIFLMNMVGVYRNSYNIADVNILSMFNSLNDRLLTFNGADLGYYCSLTFVMVAKMSTISVRFDMFIKFLISIFIGSSSESNLGLFTYHYYSHWYGGFFPLYFYFYGGILMVIFMSYIWNKFLCNCLKRKKSKYPHFMYLLGLYLICICARWYMYTPLNAFRSLLIFSTVYFLLYIFNKKLQKKELKNDFD